MASTILHYTPATKVTGKAQVAIVKGTFVMIAGEMDGRNPLVKPATADANVFRRCSPRLRSR